jgi:frataxin-like iron-binding protein CyaY
MTYGIAVLNKVQASDVDSLNRVARSATAIENGMVMQLATRSSTDGESEVWVGTVPSATAGLQNLWMAYSPEVVTTVSGSNSFKGLDSDPGNFINAIGDMIDVFKPQIGDIITLTGDVLTTGTGAASTHVVATAADFQLVWANGAVSGLSLKYLATTYISKPTGAISETQRVVAYLLEVVAIA